jgi:hypothetical protein
VRNHRPETIFAGWRLQWDAMLESWIGAPSIG